MDRMSDPNKGKGSKWWWLPGTFAALATTVRIVYEILRDHYIR